MFCLEHYSRIPPRLTFGRTLIFFVRFAVCVNFRWSPRPAPLRCAIVLPPFFVWFYCIVSVCKSQGFSLKNFDVAHTCPLQALCFIGYKVSFGSLHFCFCLSFSFCISRYVEYGTLVFCSKFTRLSTAFLRLLALTALSSSECALK